MSLLQMLWAASLLFVTVSDKTTIAKYPYFDISVSQDFVEVLYLFSVPPHGLLSQHILSP